MTEEAPLTPPIDESQRIEDPEKAHVMALAGNDERSQAAHYRMAANRYEELNQENPIQEGTDPDGSLQAQRDQRIEGLRSEADASDAVASIQEDRAGNQYEVEKNYVQDPEKAHAMALAGKDARDEASSLRSTAKEYQEHKLDDTADIWTDADRKDDEAARIEEEAGRKHDAEHVANSPETNEPNQDIDELIDLYRDLIFYDHDNPYLVYLRESIIHNVKFAEDNPEKAKEIFKKLAASDIEEMKMQAAFQFESMLSIDKELAVNMMVEIISSVDEESLTAISEVLDAFVDQDGKLKEPLNHQDIMRLLRTYADAQIRYQGK